MISNQVLQNTLEGLKEISRTEFCVLDTEGKVLASTFADFSIATQDVQAFVESQADSQLVKGFQYFKVCDDYQLEYILVAHGDDEDTYMVGKLAAFQIQNLIVAYKERFDKDSFIKNLLLDNLLLVDIYNRAKKLHIEADVRRVVMILEMPQEKDHSSMESVKSLFGGKSKDFITAVDEKSIIVVKELEDGENYPEMDQLAHTILDTLGMGNDGKTHMAYGTIVNELKEVSRSYKEARMALDVGKIFFGDKEVIAYSSLGIGRLIYQLRSHSVRCLSKKSSAANPRMTLTKRLWSQLISSSRTASMFQRHPDSFTSTETLWSTASINSRRVQVLISAFLKMPLHSRLHSW